MLFALATSAALQTGVGIGQNEIVERYFRLKADHEATKQRLLLASDGQCPRCNRHVGATEWCDDCHSAIQEADRASKQSLALGEHDRHPNVELILKVIDTGINGRHLEAMAGAHVPEYFREIPETKKKRGFSQDVRDLSRTVHAFPDYRVTVDEAYVEGSHVWCKTSVSGTHLGNLELDGPGKPVLGPSGRRIKWQVISVYWVDSGKIHAAWDYLDLASLSAQLLGTEGPKMPESEHLRKQSKAGHIDDELLTAGLEKIDRLTGLGQVKDEIKTLVNQTKMQLVRAEQGLSAQFVGSHMVFSGPPGTGKTTVARLVAEIFKGMGILSTGQLVETSRGDLVAGYVGHTAMKTNAVIDSAIGGVLFIDEAYSLVKGESGGDFGSEAIETLLKRMEDDRGEFIVIVAGYDKEMSEFLGSNPGLASRFATHIHFDSYAPEDLLAIAKQMMFDNGYALAPEADEALLLSLRRASQRGGEAFGNARGARNLVASAIANQANRLAQAEVSDSRELTLITLDDLPGESSPAARAAGAPDVDEDRLNETLAALDRLTGLPTVKNQIRSMVNQVRVQMAREQQGLPVQPVGSHMVFRGPPGTGKTTVARLVAEIFQALGILERGHLIEASRADLVAGYVGQTAMKTNEVIDAAVGGVLFIDEAYSLSKAGPGADNDFGSEAIETMLKRMEDERGSFIVIVAGYSDEMTGFLNSNPGLQSRFATSISFESYSADDLLAICERMFGENGYVLAADAREPLRTRIDAIIAGESDTFGNARGARNLVAEMIGNHANRIAGADLSDPEVLTTLTAADV